MSAGMKPHKQVAPEPDNTDRLRPFFVVDKLPAEQQAIAQPFADLAEHIITHLPVGAERNEALRRLFDARNATVLGLRAKDRGSP
jgi:hypothetical protein